MVRTCTFGLLALRVRQDFYQHVSSVCKQHWLMLAEHVGNDVELILGYCQVERLAGIGPVLESIKLYALHLAA
jgi:hypothetical protein